MSVTQFMSHLMESYGDGDGGIVITEKKMWEELEAHGFKEKKERKKKVVERTPANFPPPPEGWSGPFEKKYLWQNAKLDGKCQTFKKFEDAIEAANKMENCGGITKAGNGYSLRIGPELRNQNPLKASSAQASWTKGEPEKFIVAAHKVVEKKEPEPVVEEEEEPEPVVEEEKEEVDVEDIEIDGEWYYHDEKNNIIYTTDTNEVVGKLMDGHIVKYEEVDEDGIPVDE